MQHLPGRSEDTRPTAREGRCRTSLNCFDKLDALFIGFISVSLIADGLHLC
jgi:hypothetical protein